MLWHYNCFLLLARMQVLSIFSVFRLLMRPNLHLGLKKEAPPKFNHRNASKVWLHPTKRAEGPGMNPWLLELLFAFA